MEIIPEVENKIFYKKTNNSIGKKKKVQNKEKYFFPFYEKMDQFYIMKLQIKVFSEKESDI